ncbi:MAG: hypothetical protein MUE85_21265 [Microscillaceae bacterium]|jgi:thiamine pyrophosphokinase|nr:hypothetical protein [Microscillaceae bacterium]
MSSHHIVRDEQEPALFIYQPEVCSFEQIAQLLEWSPIVAIGAENMETIGAWGIKIDLIFYPNQSIPPRDFPQDTVQLISIHNHLLREGLEYLQNRGHRTISLLADYEQVRRQDLDLSPVELIIYQKNYKYFMVKSGQWRKWLAAGTLLQIFAEAVEIDNLQKNQNNFYQVIADGFVSLKHEGSFWLGEAIVEL